MSQPLPVEIVKFIRANIPTIGHLELLLFLFSNRQCSWTAKRLAQEMRTNEPLVQRQLVELNGTVFSPVTSVKAFQFCVENKTTFASVQHLSTLYHSHRYKVIAEVLSACDQRDP